MAMAIGKPGLLLANATLPDLHHALDQRFAVFRLWEAPDQTSFLALHSPSIRAIVCNSVVGASAQLIDALPNLEIVASTSVGLDKVDLAKCRARGVAVTNTTHPTSSPTTPQTLPSSSCSQPCAASSPPIASCAKASGFAGSSCWRKSFRKHGLYVTCSLNTDTSFSTGDNLQDNGFRSGPRFRGTRLSRVIRVRQRQLLLKFNEVRKNLPMKIFLVLLGYYSANALATILGQTGDWDVLVAGIAVAVIEIVGSLMYRKPPLTERFQTFVTMVNYWKAGFTLGLFVDAFKVGS